MNKTEQLREFVRIELCLEDALARLRRLKEPVERDAELEEMDFGETEEGR